MHILNVIGTAFDYSIRNPFPICPPTHVRIIHPSPVARRPLPHTHSQVIIVLTQLEGSGGFSIAHRLTHRLASSRGLHDWGPTGATHCPPIDNVHGLHAPRLIT